MFQSSARVKKDANTDSPVVKQPSVMDLIHTIDNASQ